MEGKRQENARWETSWGMGNTRIGGRGRRETEGRLPWGWQGGEEVNGADSSHSLLWVSCFSHHHVVGWAWAAPRQPQSPPGIPGRSRAVVGKRGLWVSGLCLLLQRPPCTDISPRSCFLSGSQRRRGCFRRTRHPRPSSNVFISIDCCHRLVLLTWTSCGEGSLPLSLPPGYLGSGLHLVSLKGSASPQPDPPPH